MKPKILIVDDEKPLRDALAKWFSPSYECLTAPDAETAMQKVRSDPQIALMITDFKMAGENGIELLRKAKAENPNLAAILLTAYGSVDLAVEAMRENGADDFFQKPVTDLKAFEARVAKAIKTAKLEKEVASLKARLGTELEDFTGKSPAMQKVYSSIRKVAPSNATVLIEGPSGSGKEIAARAIHNLSRRSKGPFVAVECAALSKDLLESELFGHEANAFNGAGSKARTGRFEAADGGTLFLDEIGEIDQSVQVKLLRALESRKIQRVGGNEDIPVDFRLIAATNRNLQEMVANGSFREDLYYRLNVIDIKTPALKDHPEDIALLALRFIKEFSAENGNTVTGIEPAAVKALEDYSWPGNVRQLRNIIEKMVVLCSGDKITCADLPVEISAPAVEKKSANNGANPPVAQVSTLAEKEKEQILSALENAGNNITKAAEMLGISRRTLHRRLNEWKIK